MSKVITDTVQGRSKDPNVSGGLTISGITTQTGVLLASSDVRITGNINAGIATCSGIVNASSDVRITGNINAGIGTLGGVILKDTNVVAGVSTADAFIPSAGQLSNRNLIINGAMNVAQRGSSTTTIGAFLADRWRFWGNGGTTTYTVESLSSGDPYDLGFRKFIRLTNTANASGAANYRLLRYVPEAQDMANSGWNYTSASSYITFSFWIRSSIAQNFYAYIHTQDGTEKNYIIETGSLTADTWTKITKVIPGGTGVQFDDNNNQGARIDFVPFWGTDYTGTVAINEWVTYSGSTRTPDMTNTWASTNGATFDLTGVQLEVGSAATPFEHRTYGDELARCQRYYYIVKGLSNGDDFGTGFNTNTVNCRPTIVFPVTMRSAPSALEQSGDATDYMVAHTTAETTCSAVPTFSAGSEYNARVVFTVASGLTAGQGSAGRAVNSDGYLGFDAEP